MVHCTGTDRNHPVYRTTVFVEPCFLKTVVYVGCQHKVVLVFHKRKQTLIHRLGCILIAVDVNIAAPVCPVFLHGGVGVKATGVHIRKSVLAGKIGEIFLEPLPVIGETCRGGKPSTCTNDHCIGMAQDLPQRINRSEQSFVDFLSISLKTLKITFLMLVGVCRNSFTVCTAISAASWFGK